ncbi:hypothetical protein Hanom_Chr15g01342631 [Helianthus anomalus]
MQTYLMLYMIISYVVIITIYHRYVSDISLIGLRVIYRCKIPVRISFLLATIVVSCKLQKVNLLMVEKDIELLVLNCYIYKFSMILKLPIYHRDLLYI